MDPTIALLDANVLYPAALRDLLMRLALKGLFRAKWSSQIHEEWMRALLAQRPDLTRAQIERTRDLMDQHAPDCLVTGHQHLIHGLELPDPNDRHVLAAACHAGATVIVTYNLQDLPSATLARFAIEAQHPDVFISELLDVDQGAVLMTVRQHRSQLKNPTRSTAQYLTNLERLGLLQSASRLRAFGDSI